MIALGIRYLTGNVVAANVARGSEWPPHPGRVFMAMAAAYFGAGEDAQERAALEWLERQKPAPGIAASGAAARSPVETYVPANDELNKKHKGNMGRSRQPRASPSLRRFARLLFRYLRARVMRAQCQSSLKEVQTCAAIRLMLLWSLRMRCRARCWRGEAVSGATGCFAPFAKAGPRDERGTDQRL